MRNLQAEIEHNLAEIDTRLPHHRRLLELIESADVSDSRQSGWDVIYAKLAEAGGGLAPPALRQGAWDAAVSTGALRLLDYELVAALSETYVAQTTIGNVFGRLVSAYEPLTFEPGRQSETVQAFRRTIVEIVNFEASLRDLYAQHLPQLQTAAEKN